MIDIKELRKDKRPQSSTVVHALLDRLEAWEAVFGHLGTPDEVGNEWRALSDRLEAAESEAIEQARLNGMGSEREAALMAKLEAAEKTNREWLRANAPGGWIDNLRIENEALRAEVIHIKEVEFPRKAQAVAEGWRGKCERLEAKIAEMERQEPVAEWLPLDSGEDTRRG